MNRYRLATIGAAAASALGIGVGVMSPAGATVAAYSPPSRVQAAWTGTVGAKGATGTVPVTVVCPAGDTGWLDVELTQKAGGDIASGYDYLRFTCTGAMQHFDVVLTAHANPFKSGAAYVQATLSWYYGDQTDAHDIDLQK